MNIFKKAFYRIFFLIFALYGPGMLRASSTDELSDQPMEMISAPQMQNYLTTAPTLIAANPDYQDQLVQYLLDFKVVLDPDVQLQKLMQALPDWAQKAETHLPYACLLLRENPMAVEEAVLKFVADALEENADGLPYAALGWYYAFKPGALEKQKAFNYFNEASVMGHAGAEYFLSLAYRMPELLGLEVDLSESFQLLLMSAQRGYGEAITALIEIYLRGYKAYLNNPALEAPSDDLAQQNVYYAFSWYLKGLQNNCYFSPSLRTVIKEELLSLIRIVSPRHEPPLTPPPPLWSPLDEELLSFLATLKEQYVPTLSSSSDEGFVTDEMYQGTLASALFETLEKMKKLLAAFERPGFLVTCLDPTEEFSDIYYHGDDFSESFDVPSIYEKFMILNRPFYCLGEKNIDDLRKLLPAFETCDESHLNITTTLIKLILNTTEYDLALQQSLLNKFAPAPGDLQRRIWQAIHLAGYRDKLFLDTQVASIWMFEKE